MPAPNPPVYAVLFDYGLVLTGPPDPASWERMKVILAADETAFHAAYWTPRPAYDQGLLTGAEYWRAVAAACGHHAMADEISTLLAADDVLWTQPNQPMIDWAGALQRAGIPTGILSNLGDAMEQGVRRLCPWIGDFAHHTFSHSLRLIKPDPAVYRHAAEGLGVAAARVLFIDDREDNIAGALAAGMQGIRYIDHEQFETAMKTAGLTSLLYPEA